MNLLSKIFDYVAPQAAHQSSSESEAKEFLPHIASFNEAQRLRIDQWAKRLPVFKRDFDSPTIEGACKKWSAAGRIAPPEQDLVQTVGAHIGNHLVAEHDLKWGILRDASGRELFGVEYDTLGLLIMPFQAVADGIEVGHFRFLDSIYSSVGNLVGGICDSKFVCWKHNFSKLDRAFKDCNLAC